MTNTVDIVTDHADRWLQKLDGIQGWSAASLIFASCIIIGWCLRAWKWFPNRTIPMAVVAWGGALFSFIANARPTTMQQHVWIVRNFIVGTIIGAIAWATHRLVLKRIEGLIGAKLADGFETTLFKKEPSDAKTPPPPPPPPTPPTSK